MQKLVRLWKRPSRDGTRFTLVLIYRDEQGKKRFESLGHADSRKAERQRAQKERELRMGIVEPGSMKLSEFLADSLERTRGQVRNSTLTEASGGMRHLIDVIGDIDYQSINHTHGERFVQACLDRNNTPGTTAKKLRHIKRVFQLAVERGQLEQNPLRRVKNPRVPRQTIRVYSTTECEALIQTARDFQRAQGLQWELLIHMALCTGMRRGELLNLTWRNIDFERKTAEVSPKQDAEYTWEWHIKDTERRTLPLTDEMVTLLAQHQAQQREGLPYVFIRSGCYDRIQKTRQQGRWTVEKGKDPLNNFDRQFRSIRSKVSIDDGEFHDFRRTCITNWFTSGLSEFDVMTLAGHSCFETTRRFYLAVRADLVDRARSASSRALTGISVARQLRAAVLGEIEKGCQP